MNNFGKDKNNIEKTLIITYEVSLTKNDIYDTAGEDFESDEAIKNLEKYRI